MSCSSCGIPTADRWCASTVRPRRRCAAARSTMNFYDPAGHLLDYRRVEELAGEQRISLRTGCFCNPGAGETAEGITEEDMQAALVDSGRPDAAALPRDRSQHAVARARARSAYRSASPATSPTPNASCSSRSPFAISRASRSARRRSISSPVASCATEADLRHFNLHVEECPRRRQMLPRQFCVPRTRLRADPSMNIEHRRAARGVPLLPTMVVLEASRWPRTDCPNESSGSNKAG